MRSSGCTKKLTNHKVIQRSSLIWPTKIWTL